jgi:hypothetical protein
MQQWRALLEETRQAIRPLFVRLFVDHATLRTCMQPHRIMPQGVVHEVQ